MTLNFAKLGLPLAGGKYQVYLRYNYKCNLKNKPVYSYIPTGVQLLEDDLNLLIAEKLGGRVAYDLYKFKESTLENINNFFKAHGFWPDKHSVIVKVENKQDQKHP
jgi:hypothetical protein